MKSSIYYHKNNCQCSFCKAKRHELIGSKHPRYIKKETRLCECGCRKSFICYPSENRRFINFHQHRGINNGFYRKHHKKETIERNRAKNKILQSGINNGMWGKHHKESTKQKLREYIGYKASNWRGGISFENYSQLWKQQLKDKIRTRDNFICQICKIPELELLKRLSIHHIDYDKKNCREDNLISLCLRCHSKTNTNREYWINYFRKGEIYA